MFRELRRKKQALTQEECQAVLERGTHGVLALAGDDGYPYAVPLNYLYRDGALVFHCARAGHKLDAIARCEKASFCVVDQDRVVPEKYTSYFRSVIAFGRVRVVADDGEKRSAIERLARRYFPTDTQANRDAYIDREWGPLAILEMTVEHLSGKEAIELVRQREK